MKLSIIILVVNLFYFAINVQAQEITEDGKTTIITYSIDNANFDDTRTLENGKYKLIIEGNYNPKNEKISIEFNSTIALSDPIDNNAEEFNPSSAGNQPFIKKYSFNIKDRSKIEVKITRKKAVTIQVGTPPKDENKIETTEFFLKFKGSSKMKWQTTIGLAGIFNFKSDTYKTIPHNEKYMIVEDGSQELISPIPLVLFTFMNPEEDYSFGASGGIGFDSETFSVFLGPSFNIGHNLIITGGLGLHKQKRLDNKYDSGDVVDAVIDSSDLNTAYYRANPFISLTFNLTNNPFSSASLSKKAVNEN